MEKNKENKDSGREKTALTPQQLQKRKKFIIFPLLFLLFAGSLWLIFAPSSGETEKVQRAGFNADIPMPKEESMLGDKRDAYEQESMKQKEDEKRRSLQDFAFMLGEEESMPREAYSPHAEETPVPADSYEHPLRSGSSGSGRYRPPVIQSSRAAYQDVNRQLGAWYDQPATEVYEQSQMEMEYRVQELERKLDDETLRKKTEEEQLHMLEKSYQLAAKYMGGNGQAVNGEHNGQAGSSAKVVAQPVRQVRHNVVSLLAAPMSDEEFAAQYSQSRNLGFMTAAGNEGVTDKNSIPASVYQTVTLTNGKELQMRLREPMLAGAFRIPAGTVLSGAAKITGERLEVTVTSIQYAGNIIPVELRVHDVDGQRGIFIPNSDETTATKEIAAGLSNSAGSNIMISDNAGSQLAADVGKGLIQGTAQYVSKKLQTVRVTVKAGYRLLLLPKNE